MDGRTLSPGLQDAAIPVPHFEGILIINRNNRHGPDPHSLPGVFPTLKKKATKIRDVQLPITRLLKTPAPLVITIKYFQAVFKGISEIK